LKLPKGAKTLTPSEININSEDFSEIISHLSFYNKNIFSSSLSRPTLGFKGRKVSDLEDFNNISELYRVVNASSKENYNRELNLPSFAITQLIEHLPTQRLIVIVILRSLSHDLRHITVRSMVLVVSTNFLIGFFLLIIILARQLLILPKNYP
jgi:hypothetical protein